MRRLTTRSPLRGSPAARRLVVAVGLSAGAVLAAIVVPSGALAGIVGSGDQSDAYKKAYAAKAQSQKSAAQGSGTIYLPDGSHIHRGGLDDGHTHDHNDPATKNAVSRAATVTDAQTVDPTTPDQARRSVEAAAAQRAQSEPTLSSVPVSPAHATSPTDRYNMFNACYGLQSTRTGRWLGGDVTPTRAVQQWRQGHPGHPLLSLGHGGTRALPTRPLRLLAGSICHTDYSCRARDDARSLPTVGGWLRPEIPPSDRFGSDK